MASKTSDRPTRLQRVMDRHGLTAAQIAAKADMSETTARAAAGGKRVSRSSSLRIAKAVQELCGVEIPAAVVRG